MGFGKDFWWSPFLDFDSFVSGWVWGDHGSKTGPDRRPSEGKTIDRDRTEYGRSGLGPVRSGPIRQDFGKFFRFFGKQLGVIAFHSTKSILSNIKVRHNLYIFTLIFLLLKVNMSIWLIRSRRNCGNLLKTLICNSATGNGRYEYSISCNPSASLFMARRYKSMEAEKELFSSKDDGKTSFEENHVHRLEYPGGKIAFTSEMNFLPGSSEERVKCYRLLDQDGYPILSNMPEHVGKELALKIYVNMVTLQTMDTLFYEAQRQGRFSFYMSSFGEEAINIASAASLSPDDHILAQYREQGVLLWRGFTLQEFANHFMGNKIGHGKGRNMPIHYGSKKLKYFTISAPLATQLPQAVGVAYSLKNDKKDACVVTYFGEGSTSEGDFHASMNFSAVLDAPIVFICRNNGWAISTPVTDQFRGDGIVVKGQAYGIQSIRVDGNDVLAVYNAVRSAREIAIKEQRPILIEVYIYQFNHVYSFIYACGLIHSL
ncbi:dehydrogenase, E1 component, Thiamine diphosphate-binding fold protein [Artemisia annua]|uniref:Dehydrogenase, E1 component, Thiamine diphosphate-binding fold protein n=1 Tax=Artemisia annua TaxID=35608 RepID=A0A2U1LLX0_ARTAN|nr:dehydrogenase, E1 component, Thiamine diphosphate-binding fold protein [Artemisia annua]